MSIISLLEDLTILLVAAAVVAFIIRTRRSHDFRLHLFPYIVIGILILGIVFLGRFVSNLFEIITILIVLVAVLLSERFRPRK